MRFKLLALGLIATSAVLASSGTCDAKPKSLYERFEGKTVKVFLAPVEDTTADKKVSPAVLRAKILDALKDRKGINFIVVDAEAQSQIIIRSQITKFEWSDHDPIDAIVGLGGTALDAAVVEDYARLDVRMSVADTATGKEFWSQPVAASVTKKPMSEAQSIPLTCEFLAKAFLRDAFNRPKH